MLRWLADNLDRRRAQSLARALEADASTPTSLQLATEIIAIVEARRVSALLDALRTAARPHGCVFTKLDRRTVAEIVGIVDRDPDLAKVLTDAFAHADAAWRYPDNREVRLGHAQALVASGAAGMGMATLLDAAAAAGWGFVALSTTDERSER